MSNPEEGYLESFWDVEEEFEKYSFNMPGYKWELMFVYTKSILTEAAAIIRVYVRTTDTYDPAPEGRQRQTIICSEHPLPFLPIPRGYFPSFLRDVVHKVVLHEADEWLKRDGVILFNPHEEK